MTYSVARAVVGAFYEAYASHDTGRIAGPDNLHIVDEQRADGGDRVTV